MPHLWTLLKLSLVTLGVLTLSTLSAPWSWLRIDALGLLLIYSYWRFDGADYLLAFLTIVTVALLSIGTTPHAWGYGIAVLVATVAVTQVLRLFYIDSYLLEAVYVAIILISATLLHEGTRFLLWWTYPFSSELLLYRTLHAIETAAAAFIFFIAMDGVMHHPHSLWRQK